MIVTTKLQTFERKTFRVKAIRATATNMHEIAEWTGGEVVVRDNRANYVAVPCGDKQEMRATYAGDWVTNLLHYNDGETPEKPNFRVYNNTTFLQAFREIMNEAQKYAKVTELLLKITRAQESATYYQDGNGDVSLLVEQTAREICNII